MTRVPVALHVHERGGSADSRTSAGEMVATYREHFEQPFAIGFVGHDSLVRSNTPEAITIDGIEHEYETSPRRLHVVNLTDHDFRYLAHPKETYPKNTREGAMEAIEQYDLDGVEKYNAGVQQYEGELPVLELAGDDAHSPLGTRQSYMVADVAGNPSEESVVEAIKNGECELVNEPSRVRSAVQQVEKSALLGAEVLRGKETFPWESIM